MKRLTALIGAIILAISLIGCSRPRNCPQIAATTLPVYEFTSLLCRNTGIGVTRLITENVSCLHDYTLQVDQMRAIEAAEVIVISGLGLEDFLTDAIPDSKDIIDAGMLTQPATQTGELHHLHEHDEHGHSQDPHIWLDPARALIMAQTICEGLILRYPAQADTFRQNMVALTEKFTQLQDYAHSQLSAITCTELITFHDGFGYLASACGLTILRAIEEESGSEASAGELIEIIQLVKEHRLPAVFTEKNGSCSAAEIIAKETGIPIYQLDMCMSGESYFDAMYYNIDVLKEALK